MMFEGRKWEPASQTKTESIFLLRDASFEPVRTLPDSSLFPFSFLFLLGHVNNGLLTHPLARSLAPLTRSLASLACSAAFTRSLARSLTRGKVGYFCPIFNAS